MRAVVMSSFLAVAVIFVSLSYHFDFPFQYYEIGEELDSFNGVSVYYNGTSAGIHGVYYTDEGYELGVKWQCVEFVRRYYLEIYGHKMPSDLGNAVDYYDESVPHGEFNASRGLIQFKNNGASIPSSGDILVFAGEYGHVAIVTSANRSTIEFIQQNVNKKSRDEITTDKSIQGHYFLSDRNVLGWLRISP
ncbi:MAG TPA: CHAP domain-containing protein [Flavobacteriales bacterium]|nr:CHAP domain-containing protein [Flavobacteriales bacterium]